MFEDLRNAWSNYDKAKEEANKRREELCSAWDEFRALCIKIWSDGGFPEMKCKLPCGADLIINSKKVISRTTREALAEAKTVVLDFINDKKAAVDSYYKG